MNKVDFIINLGTDWSQDLVINDQFGGPLDLSQYSINSKFKKHYTSRTAYPIVSSANVNVLNLSITANTSKSLFEGRYDYDVVLTDNANNHSKILEGVITFNSTVSR
jgi:hypothetical protein